MLEGLLWWLNAGPLQEVGVTGGTLAGKQPQNSLRGNSVPHIGGVVPILLIPAGSTCTFTPSQRSRAPRRGRRTLVLEGARFWLSAKKEKCSWPNIFSSDPASFVGKDSQLITSLEVFPPRWWKKSADVIKVSDFLLDTLASSFLSWPSDTKDC